MAVSKAKKSPTHLTRPTFVALLDSPTSPRRLENDFRVFGYMCITTIVGCRSRMQYLEITISLKYGLAPVFGRSSVGGDVSVAAGEVRGQWIWPGGHCAAAEVPLCLGDAALCAGPRGSRGCALRLLAECVGFVRGVVTAAVGGDLLRAFAPASALSRGRRCRGAVQAHCRSPGSVPGEPLEHRDGPGSRSADRPARFRGGGMDRAASARRWPWGRAARRAPRCSVADARTGSPHLW